MHTKAVRRTWVDSVDDHGRFLPVQPVLQLLGEHEQGQLAVGVRREHAVVVVEHRVLEPERFGLLPPALSQARQVLERKEGGDVCQATEAAVTGR